MNRILHVFAAMVILGALADAQLVRQANTTLTLPADLPAATQFMTQNAFGSMTFSGPMCTAFPAGETNRVFVAERGGAIQTVSNLSTTPTKTAYLSLTSLLAAGETLRTDGENGFLSFAFHPNFATNGTLFLYYSIQVVESGSSRLFQRLHRVTVSHPSANTATILSHTPLLTIVDRETNHNGGDLHFGSDGYLYLSLGDEGAGNDSRNNARFINHQLDPVGTTNRVTRTGFWGKLLRIDVDNRPENLAPNPHEQNSTTFPSAVHAGTYKVPADNPFIGYTRWHYDAAINPLTFAANTVRTEIYATGLRNPFRWSFDPPTGRIFLADVGQGIYEEIDIIAKGNDLGWSWREGMHPFTSGPSPQSPPPAPGPNAPPGTGFSPVEPIYEYDHTNDGIGNDAVIYGTSITGGMVYRGNVLTELYGAYIFADYNSGFIVALRQQGNSWVGQRIATDTNIVDFGTDPRNGDLLLSDLGSNTVDRLVRSNTSGTPPPATLSATGAFSDLANLVPAQGIVPYEPNVPFWSDYATKRRWFSIKNLTDTVGFSVNGNWAFPNGMVWIKHFDIETTRGNASTRRKLETRFLVKTATDVYGLSYRWRVDQTDADLVGEEGLSEVIPSSSPAQTWRYPSRTECKVCHTPVAGFALSFNTRQFNRLNSYGGLEQNQVAALSGAGYFAAPVANVNTLPALANPADTTASLEARVRSYLAANCVQCHQPGGAATGNWDARPQVPTDSAALINGALVNNAGDAANRFAVPGDLSHSMVLKRVRGDGVPRMPPLATNDRDLASEQLLIDWITQSLPTRQSFTQWQTAHFGSPGNPDAGPTLDPDKDGQTNDLEFLQRTPPTSAGLPILPAVQVPGAGDTIEISFIHPANRSCLVETSTDMVNWSLWNVPGNDPRYPAIDTPRTLSGLKTGTNQNFRLKLGEL